MHQAADKVVTPFLTAVDGATPGRYSAVLYGSAVRGGFVEGRSDVNLMLVFENLEPELLRRLGTAFERWPRKAATLPLVATAEEWRRAGDAFPIEITDMRHAYEVLRGEDPLAGLTVRHDDLRRALERELRGKLLRLRQGYVAAHGDERALGDLAVASVPTVVLLLRTLLALHGDPVPAEQEPLVRTAAARAGFDASAVLAPLSHRADSRWRWSAGDFERYLGAVAITAHHVDTLPTGDAE